VQNLVLLTLPSPRRVCGQGGILKCHTLSLVCNAQRCKGGDGANVGRCTYYSGHWQLVGLPATSNGAQLPKLDATRPQSEWWFQILKDVRANSMDRLFFSKSLHLLLCTWMGLVVVHEINFPALYAYASYVSSCSTVSPFQVRVLSRASPCCSSFSSFKGSGGHCHALSVLHS
jgi:hypothetical protein